MSRELRQRVLAPLDKAIDRGVENWGLVSILSVGGTFLFLFLFLIYGAPRGTVIWTASILGVIQVVVGGEIFLLNLRYRRQLERWADAADAIEAVILKDDMFSDWENFIDRRSRDREVERIRLHCQRLPEEYPPEHADEYCNVLGMKVLEAYVTQLRSGLVTRAVEDFLVWRMARKQPTVAFDEAQEDVEDAIEDVDDTDDFDDLDEADDMDGVVQTTLEPDPEPESEPEPAPEPRPEPAKARKAVARKTPTAAGKKTATGAKKPKAPRKTGASAGKTGGDEAKRSYRA